MSDLEDLEARLTAALQTGAPPARDAIFRMHVLVRLERARFRRRMMLAVVGAALVAVLVGVSAPTIADWMAADVRLLWIITLGSAAALVAVSRMLVEADGVSAAISALGRWLYP